jgi:hypothetical protein
MRSNQLLKRLVKPLFAFRSNKKKLAKHNLTEVFTHKDHTYYRFPKEVNLPLERFSMALGLMERISSGLSGSEMEQILEGMEKALSAGLSNPKNAAVVAGYIHVIRERQTNVIHRDLLLNLAAIWVIRDDEDPTIINPDIHNQKLNEFDAICKGGSHDFFSQLGIMPLVPLLSMSAEELQTLWEYNIVQQRKLIETLTHLDSHQTTGQRKRKMDFEAK